MCLTVFTVQDANVEYKVLPLQGNKVEVKLAR